MHCANVFRMVSSDSSFAAKPYACAPVECPAGIISLSVEYTTCNVPLLLQSFDLFIYYWFILQQYIA